MSANLFQGHGGFQKVKKPKLGGTLPEATMPLSDLQLMLENERKQHEQAYIYANGHNDHGMGQ